MPIEIYMDPDTGEAYEVEVPDRLRRLTREEESHLRPHYDNMRAVDLGLSFKQGTHDIVMSILIKFGYAVYNKDEARKLAARLLGED